MTKRILAVDDSATIREMIVFTLRQAGHEVTQATDGEAALTIIASQPPFDLIITDINMPKLDGYGLIEKVRSGTGAAAKVPMLILTTEVDAERKEKGRAVGATGWITKPFSPQKLVEIVTKICG